MGEGVSQKQAHADRESEAKYTERQAKALHSSLYNADNAFGGMEVFWHKNHVYIDYTGGRVIRL